MSKIHRARFRHSVLFRLTTLNGLFAVMSFAAPAFASTYNIPDGSDLSRAPAPWLPVVSGDIWNLMGSKITSTSIALPTGAGGLTINGAAGGSTVTLNDGLGHYGRFTNGNTAYLNLGGGDLSFTGGNAGASSDGGVFSASVLTLAGLDGSTSNVVFRNNTARAGGALSSSITSNTVGTSITGSFGSLVFDSNTATETVTTSPGGGAINASKNNLLIDATVSGALAFTNNKTNGGTGGAIVGYANGSVVIRGTYGSILFDNNRAGMGGGISTGGIVTFDATTSGTFTASNNTATANIGGGFVVSDRTVSVGGNYGGGIVFTNNTTAGSGGAIYSGNLGAGIVMNAIAPTIDISNNTATAANSRGGAFYSGRGFELDLAPNTVFTAINNSAGGAAGTGNDANGGFLYVAGGSMLFNIDSAAVATIGDANSITNHTDSIAAAANVPLTKTGAGTLVLNANNTYAGGTIINGGVVQVFTNSNLGASTGTLSFNSGTLRTTDTFTATRATTLNSGGGTFDTNAATALTMAGVISGSGALTKTGAGTLALDVNNTYAGGSVINGGTLKLATGQGAGTGTVAVNTVAGNAMQGLDLNFASASSFGNTLSGAGTTRVSGALATITGANSAYTGFWSVTGAAAVAATATTSTQNLGSGNVLIDTNGSLAVNTTGGFSFANELTGTGTLSALNNGAAFSFTAGAGSAFGGTVSLSDNSFALGGSPAGDLNTLALTNATLAVGADNMTTVGDGVQTIGSMVFNGGTVAFDVTAPDGTAADGIIRTTNGLDVNGAGSVAIHLPGGVGLPLDPPLTPGHANLFDEQQGVGGVTVQLVESQGPVTGTAGNLKLVDDNGDEISNGEVINLAQGGVTVAEGTYDYRLSTGINNDGLYVSYGLTQLNLIGTGADALVLNLGGATGNITDMGVKITGSGDLVIDAATGTGRVISLSGLSNDYTGVTDVYSGTLLLANDGVLGQTSELVVRGAATTDMAGYSQSVGALTTQAGSTLNFNGGVLTITDAQRQVSDPSGGAVANNTLFGAGHLMINPSVLPVDGTQLGFTGTVSVSGGSTVILNTASALDNAVGDAGVADVGINLATASDTLIFGDLSQHSSSAITGVASGETKVAISGAGQVQVVDGIGVTLTGENSYSGGTTIGALSTLELGNGGLSGSIAGDVLNDGTLAFNRSNTLSFTGAISGTGALMQVGTGTTTLSGLNTYSGDTRVMSGTLKAGAVDTLSANSLVTVANGGTLELAGFNQTVSGLENAGVVQIGAGTQPGTVLTVTNGYVSNGGSLLINTVLGESSSASDMLVAGTVTVGAGGATRVFVNNVDGLGALTTGNGIEVVHVNGGAAASAVGAFTLGAQVKAGAYEYTLYRNGINTADGNWYLRSAYESPVGPADPYRAEVPVDMTSFALASRFGLAMLGTCDDRSGSYVGSKMAYCRDGMADSGMWGRLFGETGDVGFGGLGINGRVKRFEEHGPSYDYDLGGFQAGMDLYRGERGNGSRNIAGLYVGAGRASGTVDRAGGGRAGKVDMDGYSLGAYWTHLDTLGWYVDAVAQVTRYSGIEARSIDGQTLKSNGWGFAGSLEAGYSIALTEGWTLTPQAQLVYQHLSLDGGHDSYGTIDYRGSDAYYGRVGAKVSTDWALEDGRSVTTFARANVWHDFGAQATTVFNTFDGLYPVALKTDLGGTWGQIGLGISGELSERVSLFGGADYNFAIGSGKGSSIGGHVGIRVRW